MNLHLILKQKKRVWLQERIDEYYRLHHHANSAIDQTWFSTPVYQKRNEPSHNLIKWIQTIDLIIYTLQNSPQRPLPTTSPYTYIHQMKISDSGSDTNDLDDSTEYEQRTASPRASTLPPTNEDTSTQPTEHSISDSNPSILPEIVRKHTYWDNYEHTCTISRGLESNEQERTRGLESNEHETILPEIVRKHTYWDNYENTRTTSRGLESNEHERTRGLKKPRQTADG